ncbi:protein tweety-like [Anopheles ziemanni]|uniref:protein tweety-like n=1 Tax=Anopheles coustani TaxID=139045 RepID=UPI00265AA22D|nr:protein tweety-like [Anopheles coustani]XP_058176370.1 protein tweety-like [Anopheles ziemanni]
MQHLQQQRALLDPAAAGHHLHLHHQQQQQQQQQQQGTGPQVPGAHVHPGQTMTINRKLHGAAAGGVTGPLPLPPVYGDDNPPPLPPLRNPQKALPPPTSTEASAETAAAGTDKQIYIYSTAKYGGSIKPNPNTTTFSATPASNSKPLPSIINCPLPDIPKSAPKDDIYVKRKLLSDHPNGSKFATLKPIPVPKIDPGALQNGGKQALPNGPLPTPADAQLPPPPPPPLPATTTSSSGSSGGSSSGYGTVGLTTSQIQSLPLPPPPLELLQEQPANNNHHHHQDHQDQALRLPPPPTNEELRSSAMDNGPTQLNGSGGGGGGVVVQNGDPGLPTDGGKGVAVGNNDDNSFYAVTEL